MCNVSSVRCVGSVLYDTHQRLYFIIQVAIRYPFILYRLLVCVYSLTRPLFCLPTFVIVLLFFIYLLIYLFNLFIRLFVDLFIYLFIFIYLLCICFFNKKYCISFEKSDAFCVSLSTVTTGLPSTCSTYFFFFDLASIDLCVILSTYLPT